MNLTEIEKARVKYALQFVFDSKLKIIQDNRALLTDAEVRLMRDNAAEFGNLIDKIK